jgi:hypothetical protein
MFAALWAEMSASTHPIPRCGLGRFNKLRKEEQAMGKGNNSQKKDKKDKKPKKDSKKPAGKTAERR